MTNTPTPEEAVERARRSQDQRIETVRALAEARQSVNDERARIDAERTEFEARMAERLRDAEGTDIAAYKAATLAGWTVDELRKIGFPEPDKKRRVRRRASQKTGTAAEPAPVPPERIEHDQ